MLNVVVLVFKFSMLNMTNYDQTRFMDPECQTLYYTDLSKTKNTPGLRHMFGKEMPENLLSFHDRLVAVEWRCFTLDPCQENEYWVRKFFANLSVVSFSNPILRIRRKNFHFGAKQINNIYGLANADME